jgi:UDP-glucose 4-epimerase
LVGAYAVGLLLERGERPVIYDVALNERLLSAVGVDPADVTLVRGDMMDLPGIISALRDNDCDRIIHLAAFLGEEVQRRPYSGVRLNFMGTVNVFEAARLERVSRVIFPSSGTVYLGSLGEGVKQIDESIPVNPPSVYAATKASCEFMGRAYAKRYGFEFVCLRYTGGLYGPSPAALKATREIAIQQMIRAAVKGEAAQINWPYGPAEILYGRDAAKGTVLAVLKDQLKDTLFHIGNADMVSGEDIVQAIRKAFPGSNIELKRAGNPMPYPESRLSSDFSRAREQLGYEPDYPIDKAVVDYGATLRRLENPAK